MFWTVFPFIISSSRQYIQQQAIISGVSRNFVRGVQQIQLRTRENGDLGAVAP